MAEEQLRMRRHQPLAAAGAAALALLVALAGCRSADERDGEKAVRAYVDEVVRAYGASDEQGFGTVATARHRRKLRVLVGMKAQSAIVLESKVEALRVVSARREGEHLLVETEERWRYHDRALKPGDADGPPFLAEMRMRYHLAREDGAWRVDGLDTVEHRYLDPDTGKPLPKG